MRFATVKTMFSRTFGPDQDKVAPHEHDLCRSCIYTPLRVLDVGTNNVIPIVHTKFLYDHQSATHERGHAASFR